MEEDLKDGKLTVQSENDWGAFNDFVAVFCSLENIH